MTKRRMTCSLMGLVAASGLTLGVGCNPATQAAIEAGAIEASSALITSVLRAVIDIGLQAAVNATDPNKTR